MFSNRVRSGVREVKGGERVVSRRPQPAWANVFTDPPIVN